MPITPFHLGVGVLSKGCGASHFSLVGFCATQIVIDVESGYFLLHGGWPLHRGIHTLIGATLVCTAVAMICRWLITRRRLPSMNMSLLDRLIYDDLECLRSPRGLIGTVALSAFGHVIPDAIMHDDVRVFAPLTDSNPFFASVPLSILHLALGLSGVLGGAIMLARWARRTRNHG
jgi:hypothetical protein